QTFALPISGAGPLPRLPAGPGWTGRVLPGTASCSGTASRRFVAAGWKPATGSMPVSFVLSLLRGRAGLPRGNPQGDRQRQYVLGRAAALVGALGPASAAG